MAEKIIDVAKQETSDEIKSKIPLSDMELIEMGKNYTNVTFNNLVPTETELVSITGEGALSSLKLKSETGGETFVKVYLDEKLLFNFSVSEDSYRFISLGLAAPRGNPSQETWKLEDLSSLINGKRNTGYELKQLFALPSFKSSLKIYGRATVSNTNHNIEVSYGFKG